MWLYSILEARASSNVERLQQWVGTVHVNMINAGTKPDQGITCQLSSGF